MIKHILIIILTFFNISFAFSQENLQIRNVATNLDTPWEILWGPDNFIWMTERYGRISRVNPETGNVIELIRINEVFEDGERGLMGLVLHPNFNSEPFVYTVYNIGKDNPSTKIKIVRYKYDGAKLIEPFTLMDNIQGWWNHDGARLWISDDEKLFVTIGDAANTNTPQDLNSLNGKILRMNLDGTIPTDNPYPNSYVYSFGHRNPQGMVFANGKIYTSEHGPSTDDEINIIIPKGNYGWPNVVGYCNTQAEKNFCETNNAIEPLYSLTPQATMAIAGMDYYNHDRIAEWKNSLLITALKDSRLVQLVLNERGDSVLKRVDHFSGNFGRLRDICISPDGRVFISTSNRDGRGSIRENDDKIIEITKTINSIKKNENKEVSIFPNPSNGEIFLNSYFGPESIHLTLVDILGNKLIENELVNSNNIIDLKVLLKQNSLNGIYYVILHNDTFRFMEKLIITDGTKIQ